MKVKFRSNPYVKVSWSKVDREMTDLVNSFYSNNHKNENKNLLKEANKMLFTLGWSLEEYQQK
jgi:hypothetical protein